jgi:hypothetical protein
MRRFIFSVLASLMFLPGGAKAQNAADGIITPYFIAMVAGPVSDGASVILVKKRPNFVSIETPVIACISGFGAGALAAALPAAAATVASGGVLAPLSGAYVVNHGIYGCIVSGVGGIVGVATAVAMEMIDGKPHSPYVEIIGP